MQTNSPAFIGIGASFSGLGFITHCLTAHPQVAETILAHNFFSSERFEKNGLAWYQNQFIESKKKLLNGDCSPAYLATSGTAERIVSSYPDIKLFVVVRNPIDRAIAHYEHAQATRRIGRNIPCSRYLTTTPTAQSDGFYGEHLHEYFAYYSPLQLHIIVYEELVADPLAVIKALYTFLGINSNFVPKQLARFVPPQDAPKRPSYLYRFRHMVSRTIKSHFKKPLLPLFPPAYQKANYFSESELTALRQSCVVDARHLTNLIHRDMGVFWDLVPDHDNLRTH